MHCKFHFSVLAHDKSISRSVNRRHSNLDHLHHSELLVVHHVAVQHVLPGEIEEAERKVTLPLCGTIAVSNQIGSTPAPRSP